MPTVTLKGTPVHTKGNFTQTGHQAPDFTLVKSDLSELTLSSLKGKKVILNMARAVIVLDEQGKIIYAQLVPEITEEPDYEKALRSIKG